MRDIHPEEVVSEVEGPGSGWYVVLPLHALSDDQLRTFRAQAEEVLGRYARSGRVALADAFRCIVEASRRRLERRAVQGRPWPADTFILHVAPDPTDPLDQLFDDRGTIVAHALAFAGESEAEVAAAWRTIATGFDVAEYQAT